MSPSNRVVRLSLHCVPQPTAAIGAGGDVAELDEVTAIRKVMEAYSAAVWTADVAALKSLYHERAAFNGSFGKRTLLASPETQYKDLEKQLAAGKTLKLLGVPQSFREVLSIRLYGNVATALVQEAVFEHTVTDVYHLMKIGGLWKIVSQLFIGSKKLAELADVAGVRAIMEKYVEGTWTADLALVKSIFHESAVMNGYVGKHAMLGTPQPFYDEMAKLASKGESFKARGLPYKGEIVTVHVYGQTAEAVVQERGYAGTLAFTDAFHLIKIDGEWKILSKLFTGARHS
mmetsp:Transcript_27434/g.55450  ORF Transcript_27434/g.55450 Transcript_27434/m.55450 type:complete len:288 (-) Transcript_27434:226-1089(-)